MKIDVQRDGSDTITVTFEWHPDDIWSDGALISEMEDALYEADVIDSRPYNDIDC